MSVVGVDGGIFGAALEEFNRAAGCMVGIDRVASVTGPRCMHA